MKPLLKVVDVDKSFNGKAVLRHASLTVNRNEVVCIIGESGEGKTTLLRCLNLLDYIDGGFIEYDGKRVIEGRQSNPTPIWKRWISGNAPYRLLTCENAYRRRFGVVFQSYNLFPNRTVIENLIEGPMHVLGQKEKEARGIARECLEAVGIADRESAYPNELSGGQQQRVGIARALAMRPEVLLLDEITSALDPPRVASLLEIIKNVRRDHNTTMVIVTHHIEFAKDVADKVCFLANGRIAEEGPPSEILANPKTEGCRAFLESVKASH